MLTTHRVMPCLLCGLIFCGPSLSQDRDLDAIQEEDLQELFDQKIAATHWVPSPRTRALALLENYELVAVGEFDPLPGASPGDPSVFEPGNVVVGFRVLESYRGTASDSIEIELNNGMLIFPGEDLSRYTKRQQVRRDQMAESEVIRQELATLERSLEAGEITLREYEDETTRISALEEQLVKDRLATSTRQVFVTHTETFYDLGGAIRLNESYLVGVSRTLDRFNVYALDEVPQSTTNIFWGETRDDVIAALDDLTR